MIDELLFLAIVLGVIVIIVGAVAALSYKMLPRDDRMVGIVGIIISPFLTVLSTAAIGAAIVIPVIGYVQVVLGVVIFIRELFRRESFKNRTLGLVVLIEGILILLGVDWGWYLE